MIGKIIAGSSFAGTVGYVIKKQSRIFSAEGITPPDVREMGAGLQRPNTIEPTYQECRRAYLPFVFSERRRAND